MRPVSRDNCHVNMQLVTHLFEELGSELPRLGHYASAVDNQMWLSPIKPGLYDTNSFFEGLSLRRPLNLSRYVTRTRTGQRKSSSRSVPGKAGIKILVLDRAFNLAVLAMKFLSNWRRKA